MLEEQLPLERVDSEIAYLQSRVSDLEDMLTWMAAHSASFVVPKGWLYAVKWKDPAVPGGGGVGPACTSYEDAIITAMEQAKCAHHQ
jgi:hypothetical protein